MEEEYQEEKWFTDLSQESQHLLESLIRAQRTQGDMYELIPTVYDEKTELDKSHYYAIHGTTPAKMVAALSHLCEDINKHMSLMASQTYQGEFEFPVDFESF